MKILVVGSKGFIGNHVFRSLYTSYDVWGCDVFTDYTESNFILLHPGNANFHDIFANGGFEICINCAGAASVPDSLKDPSKDFELNVNVVFLLLEAIRTRAPLCKLITLSSAAVYGNPISLPIREDHPLNPVSPYGFHKLYAEQLCKEYHIFFNVKVCSLRIFSAYGPGLKKQIFWDLFIKSRQNDEISLFGTGDETRDYIFIDDVVEAIKLTMLESSFAGEVFNLASGRAIRLETASSVFFSSINWKGRVVFNGLRRSGDPGYWSADIVKIQSLGFLPKITLEQGLDKYKKWLESLG